MDSVDVTSAGGGIYFIHEKAKKGLLFKGISYKFNCRFHYGPK